MGFESSDNIISASHILNAISDRQKLVSNNIANAHTPGYTAKSISFSELLGKLDNPFETDLSTRMGPTQLTEVSEGEPVNLQKELIEMQKNSLFYSIASRRVSTIFSLLKSSAQTGR